MTKSEYLRALDTALPRLPRRRRQIVAEVSDHLECAIEAECRQGVHREEAERHACARLGPPSQLAAEFAADLRVRSTAATYRILAAALALGFGASLLAFLEFDLLHHHGHAHVLWRGAPTFGRSFDAFQIAVSLQVGSLALVASLLLAAAVRERRLLRIAAGPLVFVPLVHETLMATTSLGVGQPVHVWEGEMAAALAGALTLAVTVPRRNRLKDDGISTAFAVLGVVVLLVPATLRAMSGVVVPLDPLTALPMIGVLIVPLALLAFVAGCRTVLTLRRPEVADQGAS